MKTLLLALGSTLLLASCSCTPPACVTHTDVATGATNPKAIYIRPFQIACTPFDRCTPSGNLLIRQSLAPAAFADNLQEQLAKIAPAMVLKPGEAAPLGWLVDGEFDVVESGYSPGCWSPVGNAVSRPSCVKLHVRVTEVGRSGNAPDSKGSVYAGRSVRTRNGAVVYEFDVTAATQGGAIGSVYQPGIGYPLPFDFRNAAELIATTLTPDPFKYGTRQSPVMRY